MPSLACFRSFQGVLEDRAHWGMTLFPLSLYDPRSLAPPRIASRDVLVKKHRATKIEPGASYGPLDLPRKRRYAGILFANPPAATHLVLLESGLSTVNNWFVVVLAALAGSHQAPSLDWAEDHT
ncbi:uncharacterized protein BHQ10_010100 [Talaromyces amestolkiae]|uniref:Uncharacterized protein n=1 Tax=Talaromyces amestolkiae TaxID=1196081 RepID=A0A364LE46_TALAM|nr:uncharacterized protein BHQ10_010100 [Talaromyces amestolkiae]RAO74088.1 hypothetical protein BHQ10_010100 [Talaromyces amestolkiae]